MGERESAKNPITLEVKPSGNGLKTNGHCRNVFTLVQIRLKIQHNPYKNYNVVINRKKKRKKKVNLTIHTVPFNGEIQHVG